MPENNTRGGVAVIVTGGTIDARYNFLEAKIDYDASHIREMLSRGRARIDLDVEPLMLVDSGEIDDGGRQKILEKCQSVATNKIVITHGTDTMTQTAAYLGQSLRDKTVVLVGAMIPYMFKESDALFNLGAAITAVQLLGNGVFITMNGKVFSWENVKKNFDVGEFQPLR